MIAARFMDALLLAFSGQGRAVCDEASPRRDDLETKTPPRRESRGGVHVPKLASLLLLASRLLGFGLASSLCDLRRLFLRSHRINLPKTFGMAKVSASIL
jgi:hypothetical protein